MHRKNNAHHVPATKWDQKDAKDISVSFKDISFSFCRQENKIYFIKFHTHTQIIIINYRMKTKYCFPFKNIINQYSEVNLILFLNNGFFKYNVNLWYFVTILILF